VTFIPERCRGTCDLATQRCGDPSSGNGRPCTCTCSARTPHGRRCILEADHDLRLPHRTWVEGQLVEWANVPEELPLPPRRAHVDDPAPMDEHELVAWRLAQGQYVEPGYCAFKKGAGPLVYFDDYGITHEDYTVGAIAIIDGARGGARVSYEHATPLPPRSHEQETTS
jgi:hypothetical protein